MKYNDHYALGSYIADIYAIEKPWQRFWFLLGNVLPDINKATYLQGYGVLRDRLTDMGERLSLNDRRRLLIAGHTAEGSRHYVNKHTSFMRRRYHGVAFNVPSWYSWYRIGKLTHYVADRFTFPHTLRCHYGFWTHVDYEEYLHERFSRFLVALQSGGKKRADRMKSIVRDTFGKVDFDALYKAYRDEKNHMDKIQYMDGRQHADTDCIYIIAVCIKYMGYILPRHMENARNNNLNRL